VCEFPWHRLPNPLPIMTFRDSPVPTLSFGLYRATPSKKPGNSFAQNKWRSWARFVAGRVEAMKCRNLFLLENGVFIVKTPVPVGQEQATRFQGGTKNSTQVIDIKPNPQV